MTKCFEVSTKRSLLTAANSMTIYSREADKSFVCRDEYLFESLRVGDYMGVNDDNEVTYRISKEKYLLGAIKKSGSSASIGNE